MIPASTTAPATRLAPRGRPARRLGALAASSVILIGVFAGPLATSALGATLGVTTLADSGAGSLRQAITDAASGDTITFSVSGVIALASPLPTIASSLTIDGGGAITVSGANSVRPFTVSGGTVVLTGLTITHGAANPGNGGAISNAGTLTVSDSTISSSLANAGDGGGIDNSGTLTVVDSTITGNTANGGVGTGLGGGIHNTGTLTITNSTIAENTGQAGDGGGIFNAASATVTVRNATIAGNSALNTSGGGLFNAGTANLRNTLLVGNSASISGTDLQGSLAVNTANLIGIPAGKTISSIFAGGSTTPAVNGGPTRTLAIALVSGNPAADNGDTATCGATPVSAKDQRGDPRPSACDIGAYEAQPPTIGTHGPITVAASSANGAVVNFTNPSATNEQGATIAAVCVPASGSAFPAGQQTAVHCTATDGLGHVATSSFTVTVGAFAGGTPTPTPVRTASPKPTVRPRPTLQLTEPPTDTFDAARGSSNTPGSPLLLAALALTSVAALIAPRLRRRARGRWSHAAHARRWR